MTFSRTIVLPVVLVSALAVACGAPAATAPSPSTPPPTAALPPPSSPRVAQQVDGMKKLAFMVGRWAGDGWVVNGPGGRVDIHQTEQVDLQLSGEVMTVAGHGVVPGKPGAPEFNAFAVATFDPATSTYRWEAFSQGSRLETTLEVRENGWKWGFEAAPGILVRYDSTFTVDTWHETGETSVDGGKTWNPSLDMTLQRTG